MMEKGPKRGASEADKRHGFKTQKIECEITRLKRKMRTVIKSVWSNEVREFAAFPYFFSKSSIEV